MSTLLNRYMPIMEIKAEFITDFPITLIHLSSHDYVTRPSMNIAM